MYAVYGIVLVGWAYRESLLGLFLVILAFFFSQHKPAYFALFNHCVSIVVHIIHFIRHYSSFSQS